MARVVYTKMLSVPCQVLSVDSPAQHRFLEAISKNRTGTNLLGRGSFGVVFKALYKGKPVAVKVIEGTRKKIDDSVQHEANILGFNHKNIVKIFKIKVQEGCAIIIMERLPGQCLQSLVDSVQFSLFHRLNIMSDIVYGLSYCHQNKLLHLDLKPQNVLITLNPHNGFDKRPYVCKLCDFGCSVKLLTGQSWNSRPGGTVRYMSPNVLQGKAPTEADDIYSVGITMWQLESGQHPYSSIECNETVAYNVVKRGIRPISCSDFSNREQHSSENIGSTKNMSHYDRLESKNYSSTLQQRFGNVLNRNGISPDTRATKRSYPVVFSADRLNRKKPELNVSDEPNLLRISKKLNFDKKLSPLKHVTLNEVKDMPSDQLNEIFRDKSVKDRISIKIEYSDIYINCWQVSNKARPTASELLLKLNVMLMALKEEI